MVNFTVLCNVVLTSSKIIRQFETSQLIFTWHKMASMCAKLHCDTISSLENTRIWHFLATVPYSGNTFFNKSFIRLVKQIFCLVETVFFDQSYFSARQEGQQFSKKELIIASGQLIFWLVETIFISIFQRLLPVIALFPSSGNDVSRKSFILASGNGFRANNGVRKKKEKLKIKEYCFH